MPRVSPLLSLISARSTCGVCTRGAHDGDACPHERTPRIRRRRSPRAALYPARRAPTVEGSPSLSLSIFKTLSSVHHPGYRRVTPPRERYVPLLRRRMAEEHLANVNTRNQSTTPSIHIAAVDIPLLFVVEVHPSRSSQIKIVAIT